MANGRIGLHAFITPIGRVDGRNRKQNYGDFREFTLAGGHQSGAGARPVAVQTEAADLLVQADGFIGQLAGGGGGFLGHGRVLLGDVVHLAHGAADAGQTLGLVLGRAGDAAGQAVDGHHATADPLQRLACAWALIGGRSYVVPDDVRGLATAVLAHRLVLEPEAEFDGVTAEQIVGQLLLDVPEPQENGTA